MGSTASEVSVGKIPEVAVVDEIESFPEEESGSWVKSGVKTVPSDESGFLEHFDEGRFHWGVHCSNEESFSHTFSGEEIEFGIDSLIGRDENISPDVVVASLWECTILNKGNDDALDPDHYLKSVSWWPSWFSESINPIFKDEFPRVNISRGRLGHNSLGGLSGVSGARFTVHDNDQLGNKITTGTKEILDLSGRWECNTTTFFWNEMLHEKDF